MNKFLSFCVTHYIIYYINALVKIYFENENTHFSFEVISVKNEFLIECILEVFNNMSVNICIHNYLCT